MKTAQKSENVHTAPAFNAVPNASPAARRAWSVKFNVPAPETMPSDRLKARAELVRSALGCGACSCSSY
jgi:hypothetical protein